MTKLYFRYGTVTSSKTANLLLVAHNYKIQGKKIILIKPSIDDRKAKDIIYSRCGLEKKADIILNPEETLLNYDYENIDCIVCDEAQFLTKKQITELRYITSYKNIPVICYGLKTDYRGKLFEGSQELLCLADSIEEIKTTCYICNKKAIMNLKIDKNGNPIYEGDNKPDLGFEDKYLPTCYKHYSAKLFYKEE